MAGWQEITKTETISVPNFRMDESADLSHDSGLRVLARIWGDDPAGCVSALLSPIMRARSRTNGLEQLVS